MVGLIHFQRAGHIPIAVIGGATGRVGDPSGRSTERLEITEETIKHNLARIKKQIGSIFDNHAKYLWKPQNGISDLKRPKYLNVLCFCFSVEELLFLFFTLFFLYYRIIDNFNWYDDLKLIDFVSNIGRNFRMSDMLSIESVKTRLSSPQGMSFSEFSYQIFQSYDWLRLFQQQKCGIQLGGSDQMGNIVMGHHLIRRVTGKPSYGLTIPLLVDHHGNKLGKTADNAIFLNPEKTSPYSLYQFFIRIADLEVEYLLKMLTFRSITRINEIMEKHRENPHLRKAQEKLAEDVTLLVHGSILN